MIIRTKTIGTIATIAITAMIQSANAKLVDISKLTFTSTGYCNDSCTEPRCPVAFKTDSTARPTTMQALPTCTDDNTNDIGVASCWRNKTSGNYIICTTVEEHACDMFKAGIKAATGSWATHNSSNHSVARDIEATDSSNYYHCKTTKTKEYGCAANYYATSGTGTSSINCTLCPSSLSGGLGSGESNGYSATGNTLITGCYIPQDIEICDSPGCFDTTKDCYYKN